MNMKKTIEEAKKAFKDAYGLTPIICELIKEKKGVYEFYVSSGKQETWVTIKDATFVDDFDPNKEYRHNDSFVLNKVNYITVITKNVFNYDTCKICQMDKKFCKHIKCNKKRFFVKLDKFEEI